MHPFVLFLHVMAVIFWIGPSLGAWIVLSWMQKEGGDPVQAMRWFEKIQRLEHFAFGLLLVTGLTLLMAQPFPWPDWLNWKLMLVFLIVLPFEVADIVFTHFWLPKKLASDQATEAAALFHKHFIRWSRPVFLVVLAIVYLAVTHL